MSRKAIIWISVSAILVGGAIGGYLWWQNSQSEEEESDTTFEDDDWGINTNTGDSTGESSGGGTGGTLTTEQKNFRDVKKAFPSAKVFGNRISYSKTIDLGGGIKSTVTVFFYSNGRFSFTINGVAAVMKGSYYSGAKRMRVTEAKGNWASMKGRIVSSTPTNNVIALVKRL